MKTTDKKGFTLIEIMVVIAIIGILAGVVIVSVSAQRVKARSTAALEVAESVLPAAIECNLRGMGMNRWNSSTGGGNAICNGSGVSWPTLNTPSTMDWTYGDTDGSTQYWLYYPYTSPATYVLCPITYTGWQDWGGTNSVLPGTCVVRQ